MKKAFTMIELVFVIVVIGILAAVIIPNTRTNPVYEAATQLQSHIRYTQHLAMVDDKFDANTTNWHRNRWQIRFSGNTYSIVSNNNTVVAKDTMNADNNLSVDLSDKYSTTVDLTGCTGGLISFDHLGRPILGDLSANTSAYAAGQLISSSVGCVINLSNGTESVNIKIEPETGYVRII